MKRFVLALAAVSMAAPAALQPPQLTPQLTPPTLTPTLPPTQSPTPREPGRAVDARVRSPPVAATHLPHPPINGACHQHEQLDRTGRCALVR